MTVTLAKWTIDEYHSMIKAGLLDNRQVELLKGAIVEMSPEGEAHAYFSSEAEDYLALLNRGRKCRIDILRSREIKAGEMS